MEAQVIYSKELHWFNHNQGVTMKVVTREGNVIRTVYVQPEKAPPPPKHATNPGIKLKWKYIIDKFVDLI